MESNPYTPIAAAGVRRSRCRARPTARQLARVAAYGETMGPLTVVTGPRGMGKTSLLQDIQTQATESSFVSAWVSCVKFQPFLADMVERVIHALLGLGTRPLLSAVTEFRRLASNLAWV